MKALLHTLLFSILVSIPFNANKDDKVIHEAASYFSCFDTGRSAELWVYADQPKPNSRVKYTGFGSMDFGHVFIALIQGDKTRVAGFYPTSYANIFFNPKDKALLKNDSGLTYDVAISVAVSPSHMPQLLSFLSHPPQTYHLYQYNCTDFAIEAASLAGLSLPKTRGKWPGGQGCNPADLGEDIREMEGQVKRVLQSSEAPTSTIAQQASATDR